MMRRRWPARVIKKYVLLQLPGLLALIFLLKLIHRWFAIPEWLFWISIAIWVVKDAILFPFVWRAYDSARQKDEKMLGARGIAKERLEPSGYVFVRGELWKAVLMKGSPTIEEGEGLLVHAKEGLTLVVQSDKVGSSETSSWTEGENS